MASSDAVRTPPFGSQEYRDYFRTDFVEKDGAKGFLGIGNGNVYMMVVFVILIAVPSLLALQITQFQYYFLLLLPVYFLICNLLEYLLHRYPMHNKTKGMEFLFEHVTVHHSFFNEDFYYYEQPRDYMAVFLPILYFSFISFIFFIVALLIYFVSDLDNALFFCVIGFAYYLMYETLHFTYHAKSGSLIKKLPFVEQSAKLHLLHHRANLMSKYNFNITFPIFDKVFNTLYKED